MATPAEQTSLALTYSSYLALDDLLAAQRPRSSEHDELLFIVIHQVYELWFKQLLHEFDHLQRRLEDGDGTHALHTLRRILTILKTIVAQIDVLETLTPRQFTSFRDRLAAASGFQSAQFRVLEAVLGRRDPKVLDPYRELPDERAAIEAAMSRPTVFDSLLRWLVTQGHDVPRPALERDPARPIEPSDAVQQLLLEVYERDDLGAEMCERFVDVDEGLQEWRYRHVQMVQRTIGTKAGTGGSAGADYLKTTLFRPAFPDLWAIRDRL